MTKTLLLVCAYVQCCSFHTAKSKKVHMVLGIVVHVYVCTPVALRLLSTYFVVPLQSEVEGKVPLPQSATPTDPSELGM